MHEKRRLEMIKRNGLMNKVKGPLRQAYRAAFKAAKKGKPKPEPKPRRKPTPRIISDEVKTKLDARRRPDRPAFKKKEIIAKAAYPPASPALLSDVVSIDALARNCGRELLLSALVFSQNPKIQRFIDLWRLAPERSFDDLCADADIGGDVLIGTATQILVRINANVDKIIAATGHPDAMRATVAEAAKPENFTERMAFHTMMGWQVEPQKAPLVNQQFNLGSGVPMLSQCPDPIRNVHPMKIDAEVYDDATPEDGGVPATLSAPASAENEGQSTR